MGGDVSSLPVAATPSSQEVAAAPRRANGLRKCVFWLHLAAGLVAGTVVLIMAVTGVLLSFERQLTEWADRGLRVTPSAENAARLPVETLLARVAKEGVPSGLTVRSDPNTPAAISFGRDRTIFVNPYTGVVLGEGSNGVGQFFHVVTDVHRWLGTSEKNRAVGRGITGACNLAFLFLVVSGFYLWWPRQWTKSALRAVTVPSSQLRGKARDFNWHNAFGFWSAPILFFIVLTGVLISYPWATDLLYRATGNEPPPPRSGPGGRREGSSPSMPKNLDQLWATAEQRVAGWQTISVRFGSSPNAPLAFTIDQSHRGRPDLRAQLTLDPKTGAETKWEPFSSYNLGRQLRTWGRWIHTGEAGGWPGQLIAACASAGAAVLVWTGFALSWRRFRGRKRSVQTSRNLAVLEPAGTSK